MNRLRPSTRLFAPIILWTTGCQLDDPGFGIDGVVTSDGGLSESGAEVMSSTSIEPDDSSGDEGALEGDGSGEGGASEPLVPEPKATLLAAGLEHTCAKASTGQINCWGIGEYGALGHSSLEDVGDDELPSAVQQVDLGDFAADVVQLAPGSGQTCALGSGGNVRCWGYGPLLGYGSTEDLGDDEPLSELADVQVGGEVQQISTHIWRTCALLVGGGVRCWGANDTGGLGYGYSSPFIGDDELPAKVGDVPLGAEATAVAVGGEHICALTAAGNVRCWGSNAEGQLGYPGASRVGDDETPADLGDVDLGGQKVVEIAVGGIHSCARTEMGRVYCWGSGQYGQLGHGIKQDIGDDESPLSAGPVEIDDERAVIQIAAGAIHTCALLADRSVKCWGYNHYGELGYGNKQWIGDDELPRQVGDVPVGAAVQQLVLGVHTCALLTDGAVRCWGRNDNGQLGYGHTSPIGRDQTPDQIDHVRIFEPEAG